MANDYWLKTMVIKCKMPYIRGLQQPSSQQSCFLSFKISIHSLERILILWVKTRCHINLTCSFLGNHFCRTVILIHRKWLISVGNEGALNNVFVYNSALHFFCDHRIDHWPRALHGLFHFVAWKKEACVDECPVSYLPTALYKAPCHEYWLICGNT